MTYDAITSARKEAEAQMGSNREGIRLGLQMRRERELKKSAKDTPANDIVPVARQQARSTYRNPHAVGFDDWPRRQSPDGVAA
ncbi:hypothetical protein D3Y55_21040 [Mesorhizobium sp. DCY119]|nr:hypothetical protein D3Y55_21040 [Mesorhizobium sp. DCY119]